MTTQNELQIIQSAQMGDASSFEILVNTYSALVFTMIYRRVPNREDAEEIAQDVFLRVHKYLSSYRGESKFSTWLCTIANNTAFSFLQKKKMPIQELDLANQAQHFYTEASNELETKQNSDALETQIKKLSAEDAQLILLYYQGEQSLKEMAQILSLEENTVKVKLHRARKKLKGYLEKTPNFE